MTIENYLKMKTDPKKLEIMTTNAYNIPCRNLDRCPQIDICPFKHQFTREFYETKLPDNRKVIRHFMNVLKMKMFCERGIHNEYCNKMNDKFDDIAKPCKHVTFL